MSQGQTPAGWYHAEGDPPGTTRYWDGSQWVGDPQASDPLASPPMGAPAGGFGPSDWGGSPVTAPRLIEPGSRIGGRLLDGLIWALVGLVVNLPQIIDGFREGLEAAQDGVDPDPIEISTMSIVVGGLITMVVIVAYEVLMNSRFGGTLGKRATSAQIIAEDGSPLDDRRAFMRMVPYIAVQLFGILTSLLFQDVSTLGSIALGSPFWILALAGLIMVFQDSRRQAPWDKVAKTIVVLR